VSQAALLLVALAALVLLIGSAAIMPKTLWGAAGAGVAIAVLILVIVVAVTPGRQGARLLVAECLDRGGIPDRYGTHGQRVDCHEPAVKR